MVRCPEFYEKWKRCGNFCEKHPDTAERINKFLDQILPLIEEELAESEIFQGENAPKGAIITETASRPLLSEESDKLRKLAAKQIVKKAEEKAMDDKEPTVTESEVKEIVAEIKESSDYKPTFNITNDNIEWSKYTWNPVTGCLHNCKYCYARDIANRFFSYGFKPMFHPDRLDAPKNTKLMAGVNPYVFVCSMADLFGDWVPNEWIDKILDNVRKNPQWTFLFLTKNPARLINISWPKNAWVGATIDANERVKPTIEALKQVKASIRFVSCEPLQEPIIFDEMPFEWLIIGGRSSSSGAKEFHPPCSWIAALVNQAKKHNVKVYFKPNLCNRITEFPA